MKLDKIVYRGYECLKIENELIELYVALEFGIRIIRFGFKGEDNLLGEDINIEMSVEDDFWKMRGGHRLWHSPEMYPRTYIPDNRKINYMVHENKIVFTSGIEKLTNIEKSIEIIFLDTNKVEINNILINRSVWDITTSAWAITIMAKGGEALVPLTKRQEEFLSTRNISFWPYTRFDDKRFRICQDNFFLKQTEEKNAFKIGINNEDEWAAYKLGEAVFAKEHKHNISGIYPDNGCSFEIYTNDQILELETLSEIKTIKPKEKLEHKEIWSLYKNEEYSRESIEKLLKNKQLLK